MSLFYITMFYLFFVYSEFFARLFGYQYINMLKFVANVRYNGIK